MIVYIFSGLPGSGKSSLSKVFSRIKSCPRLSKDDEQVSLFEKYGYSTSEEKKMLVNYADLIIANKIKKIVSSKLNSNILVIDKFVRDNEIINLLIRLNCKIYFIYCYARPDIIFSRFKNRTRSERPISMDIQNVYPYKSGVSKFLPQMSEYKILEELKKQESFLKKISNINLIKIDNSKMSIKDELKFLEDIINED